MTASSYTHEQLYPYTIKFAWWRFGRRELVYASCASEANAIARRWRRGVRSAEMDA